MKPETRNTIGSRTTRRPVGRSPLSYDRLRIAALRPSDLNDLFARTGWYSDFRQKLILDLVDFAWCRRARIDFDVVLRLQPWPMRLRERVHPFHPQPKSHKGQWGRGGLRTASRRGTRRRPNVHRQQMESTST